MFINNSDYFYQYKKNQIHISESDFFIGEGK